MRNETESLLATIDLSLDNVYDIIKKGTAKRYLDFPRLREITTVDDMTQDVLVYLLATMKSTHDIRLNHYIKKNPDRTYIINLINQAAYQLPIYLLRGKEAKEKILSLDFDISDNNGHKETLANLITDETAEYDVYDNVHQEYLMEQLVDELNTLNYNILKIKNTHKKNNTTQLTFLMDTTNCIKAFNKTRIQLQIIKDLYQGYSKTELRKKYTNFREDLDIIKTAFAGKLNTIMRTR